jgi:hypothetical protein
LFLFLVAFLPNNFYLGAKINGYDERVAVALYAISLITVGLLLSRWALSLPAIASGAARPSMTASWRMTKGNAFRILAGFALLVAAVDMFYRVAQLVLGAIAGSAGIERASGAFAAALSAVTWTLAVGLLATYLSLAYRHFAGPQHIDILRDEFM